MNILIREISLNLSYAVAGEKEETRRSRFEPIRIGHILQRGLLQERMRRLSLEPRKYW